MMLEGKWSEIRGGREAGMSLVGSGWVGKGGVTRPRSVVIGAVLPNMWNATKCMLRNPIALGSRAMHYHMVQQQAPTTFTPNCRRKQHILNAKRLP